MKYKFIIGIDPSGAYTEGKGTTGICLIHADTKEIIYAEDITAKTFPCKEAYWQYHLRLLQKWLYSNKKRAESTMIVIEDYLLYETRASSQINSRMETPKLIGILQYWCYQHDLPYTMQLASEVKSRWSDNILEHKGILKKKSGRFKYNEHIRDSIRHAIHYATFKNKED